MLKGKKVFLRSIRKNDINNLLKWCNDPEIIQYMYLYLPTSEVAEEKWIDEIGSGKTGKDAIFVIEIRVKKQLVAIGICGIKKINWKDRNAEIGIIIGEKKYWHKGYGTEALILLINYGFNQLNLHRLWAGIFGFNYGIIPMFEKIEFQKEGCLRSAIFKNGKYWDITILGLLKDKLLFKKE